MFARHFNVRQPVDAVRGNRSVFRMRIVELQISWQGRILEDQFLHSAGHFDGVEDRIVDVNQTDRQFGWVLFAQACLQVRLDGVAKTVRGAIDRRQQERLGKFFLQADVVATGSCLQTVSERIVYQ